MDQATTSALEAHADATVGARRFLATVKPRVLRTDKGRAVTTTELAESLVRRADLEHAVVPGKRPATILCADCKATVNVGRTGVVPERCGACAKRLGVERNKARRAQNPRPLKQTTCADCGKALTTQRIGGAPRKRCVDCDLAVDRLRTRAYQRMRRAKEPEKMRAQWRRSNAKRRGDKPIE